MARASSHRQDYGRDKPHIADASRTNRCVYRGSVNASPQNKKHVRMTCFCFGGETDNKGELLFRMISWCKKPPEILPFVFAIVA